jgi:WD40 repeat protein
MTTKPVTCPVCGWQGEQVPACPRCGWTLHSEELILMDPQVLVEYERRLEEQRAEWARRQARPAYGALLLLSEAPLPFALADARGEAPLRLDGLPPGLHALRLELPALALELALEIAAGEALLLPLSPDLLHTAQREAAWDFSPASRLEGHGGPVWSLALDPSARLLASASSDGTLRLWDPSSGLTLRQLRGHLDWVRAVAVHPDGQQIASAGLDYTLRLWDAATGYERHAIRISCWILRLTFSADGELLAAAGDNGVLYVYPKASESQALALHGHAGPVPALAFHPRMPLLASGGEDRTLRLWDLSQEGKELVRLETGGAVGAVAFHPSGHLLASGNSRGRVQLWSLAAREEVAAWNVDGAVHALAFHPSGALLAAAGEFPYISVWSLDQGREVARLEGPAPPLWALAFHPNGRRLFAAGSGPEIHAWSLHARWTLPADLPRWPLNEPPPRAWLGVRTDREAMLFLDGAPAGETTQGFRLLSELPPGPHTLEARTETEKAVLSVELQPGEIRRVELALQPVYGTLHLRGWIRGLQAELEGRPIAGPGPLSGLRPGRYTLRFRWEGHTWSTPVEIPAEAEVELSVPAHLPNALRMLERWQEQRTWSAGGGPVTALAFAPRGHRLTAATADGTIHVWDLRAPSQGRAFPHPGGPAVALAFRSDGRLLSLGADGALRVWDPSRGRELQRLENPAGAAPIQALSPDGRWLAALGPDSALRLYALPEGREVRRLEGDFAAVSALAFSPGGNILLVRDAGGTIRGYDRESGRLLWTRTGIGDPAGALAMHPRIPLLALGTFPGILQVLEAEGGHPLRGFPAGKAALRSAAFSADGRWLALGAADGTIRLWDLQGARAAEPARPRRLPRALPLAVGLLALGLLLLALQPGRFFSTRPSPTLPAGKAVEAATPTSIGCRGGTEAGEIFRYLRCYDSPMVALAEPMFRLGQAYNVDPRLMVALAGAATRFGKEGPCAQKRNNPWAYRGQGRECQAFQRPSDAAEAVALALWTQIHQEGVKTFEELISPWCPNPTGCPGWIEEAARFYREQGGDPRASDFRFTSTGRPVLSGKFRIGDAVRVTTAGLRVRRGPGSRFPIIQSVSPPERGVVIAGPISRDGYVWWGIRYSGGVVGWSIESGLAPDVPTPTPTPTPTRTPTRTRPALTPTPRPGAGPMPGPPPAVVAALVAFRDIHSQDQGRAAAHPPAPREAE